MNKRLQNVGKSAALALILIVISAVVLVAGFIHFYAGSHVVQVDSATVQSSRIEITAATDGQISAVDVVEGQFVKRGDVLFSLDPSQLEARADFALMDLIKIRSEVKSSNAEMTANRSTEEPPAVESDPRYRKAKALYRQAVFDVQSATVRSTMEGTVTDIGYQVGDTITASESVMDLVDDNQVWIEASVSPMTSKRLSIDQRADIELTTFPDMNLPARLTVIGEEDRGAASVSSNGAVRLRLVPEYIPLDSVLQPGQTVSVRIDTEDRQSALDYLRNLLSITNPSTAVNSQKVETPVLESVPVIQPPEVMPSTVGTTLGEDKEALALQRVLVANAIERDDTASANIAAKVEMEAETSIDEVMHAQIDEVVTGEVEKDQAVAIEEDIPAAIEEDIPVAIEEDIPVAIEEDTPVAVEEDSPVAVEEDSPLADEEDSPLADEKDTPVAVEEDTPVAVEEDSPVAIEEVSPVAIEEVSPVAIEEDSPVAIEEVSPVAIEEDTPVAIEEDTPVAIEEDTPVAIEEDTPVAIEEDTSVAIEEVATVDLKKDEAASIEEEASLAINEVKTAEVIGVIESVGFPTPSAESDNDNQWVLNLPTHLFTVQIVSGGNPQLLQKVASTLTKDRPHMIYRYKNKADVDAVYALATGLYRSRDEAAASLELLSVALVKNKPWIRKIDAIQRLIEQ